VQTAPAGGRKSTQPRQQQSHQVQPQLQRVQQELQRQTPLSPNSSGTATLLSTTSTTTSNPIPAPQPCSPREGQAAAPLSPEQKQGGQQEQQAQGGEEESQEASGGAPAGRHCSEQVEGRGRGAVAAGPAKGKSRAQHRPPRRTARAL